jgi:hypothetical protein
MIDYNKEIGDRMRIGYSFWGYLTPFEENTIIATPDGERGNRVDFVEEMLKRGHQVTRLQAQRDEKPYKSVALHADGGFPDVDVAYFEWRWPTWKNDEKAGGDRATEPDYRRQMSCLEHYHKKGVPIIIHDGDLKMTPEEELMLPNAVLTDACANPRVQTRKRLTLPWCNYLNRRTPTTSYSYNYTYVGNNYERDKQFKKYYSMPARGLRDRGVQTMVYGNWLERSPERRDPSELLRENPHVSFGGRLAYNEIFEAFNRSITVTHITKDEYTPYGNITGRFMEGVMSGVVALIPNEYVHARPVGLGEFIVDSPEDVIRCINVLSGMSAADRAQIVQEQERALRKVVDIRPEHRVDIIEAVARGEIKA